MLLPSETIDHCSKPLQPPQIWQGGRVTPSSGIPLRDTDSGGNCSRPSLLHHESGVCRAIQGSLAKSCMVKKREEEFVPEACSFALISALKPWSFSARLQRDTFEESHIGQL